MYRYPGSEIDLFARATRWKRYAGSQVAGWLRGRVLEVGAGVGATTRILRGLGGDHWTCLEPDGTFCRRLRTEFAAEAAAGAVLVVEGTLGDLPVDALFDLILYPDVLEHIADDRAELALAARHLTVAGSLAVLAPAHQSLYSSFDAAVGHHRRYDRASLLAIAPAGLSLTRLRYLDAAGLLLSVGNRLVLRAAVPSEAQVRFWDGVMVPLSRLIDPLLRYRLGKSIVAVWSQPSVRPQDWTG